MKTIFGGFVFLLISIFIFTSINIVGSNISSDNLDVKSQNVLLVVNSTLINDININDLDETIAINDTNAQDKSSFGFEFLKATSDVNKKVSVIDTIENAPAIVIATTGANSNDFEEYINIVVWFLGILISLIIFDAIFTRRVFNR